MKWYDGFLWKQGIVHSVHAFLWMTARVCGVCVPTPSYCVPILSKRQKAHLDLVGWKVDLLHRALLVNWGLPPVSKVALRLHLVPPALPWICKSPPCLKVPSSANIETLQVNHKTETPPDSSFTNTEGGRGVTKDTTHSRNSRNGHEAVLRTGSSDRGAASANH